MSRTESPLRGRMIFNVGARRSGTFWLQRIVSAHPEVAAVPTETYLFSHGVKPLMERFHHGARGSPGVAVLYADHEVLLDAVRDFCDRVFVPYVEGARFLAERTPFHVHHLGLIASIYPDARFAHIVRDGRDVARSLVAQPWGPDSIAAAASEWRTAVEAWRKAGTLAALRTEVRYEELLANPESSVRTLYANLGLPATDAAVDAGVAEARAQLNVDRTTRSVAPEKWRMALSGRDLREFDRVAGDLLRDLDYPDAVPGRRRARSGGAPARPVASPLRRMRSTLRALNRRRLRTRSAAHEQAALRDAMEIANRVLESIQAGRAEDVLELLDDTALLQVRMPPDVHEGRGADARAALVVAFRDQAITKARQTRGDLVLGVPTVGAMLSYELPDGSTTDALLLVTVRGQRIARLVWNQPPPRPPAQRSSSEPHLPQAGLEY